MESRPLDIGEISLSDCLNFNNSFYADLRACQLTEMHGLMVDPANFQENYVNHVTKLMNAKQIYHGVIASNKVNRLRNCMIRPETFVLLNCADSESKLKQFYDSRKYRTLLAQLFNFSYI